MEDFFSSNLTLIVQLVSGAVGGNIVGSLMKNLSLGTLWNSVSGIVGGVAGGKILEMLTGAEGAGEAVAAAAESATSSGFDLEGTLKQVAGGGVGGGVVMAIIGFVKKAMNKS